MELQEENTIQSQDKMQIKEFHHTRSYTQSQNLARLLIIVQCVQSVTSNSLLNKVVLDMWKFQGHITRSEIPARLPLPRLYNIDTSWMQGTADSSSSRKFFSDVNYNQGWYKRESIFLQKEDRLSFVPTLIIVDVTKEFLPCIWSQLSLASKKYQSYIA